MGEWANCAVDYWYADWHVNIFTIKILCYTVWYICACIVCLCVYVASVYIYCHCFGLFFVNSHISFACTTIIVICFSSFQADWTP